MFLIILTGGPIGPTGPVLAADRDLVLRPEFLLLLFSPRRFLCRSELRICSEFSSETALCIARRWFTEKDGF